MRPQRQGAIPTSFASPPSVRFGAEPPGQGGKADYRATHKVGVQSCKIYVKPEEEAAYYVVNKVGGKLPL